MDFVFIIITSQTNKAAKMQKVTQCEKIIQKEKNTLLRRANNKRTGSKKTEDNDWHLIIFIFADIILAFDYI